MVNRRGPVPPSADQSSELPVYLHRCVELPGTRGYRAAVAPGVMRAAASADVVHVNQFGSLTAQLLGAVGRLRRRSTFVTDHGSSGVELGGRLGLHRLFDGFLEVSEFAGSFTPQAKTRVVRGGVDLDLFKPGGRSHEPFVLYVGRLLPHKGVDWLIRSLPEGARLVVAGRADSADSEYLKLLRSLARDRDVRFILDPPDAEIAQLYRSAWALVLPSVTKDVFGRRRRIPELFGLTAVEAMASATPAVVSDVGSLPELVRDGETGFVVRSGDVAALRAVLTRLLEDQHMVESMGAAARRDAESLFTWDQVAARCMEAYRELGR